MTVYSQPICMQMNKEWAKTVRSVSNEQEESVSASVRVMEKCECQCESEETVFEWVDSLLPGCYDLDPDINRQGSLKIV